MWTKQAEPLAPDCGPSGNRENSGFCVTAAPGWAEYSRMPVASAVSPGWPLTATTVPADGATIRASAA